MFLNPSLLFTLQWLLYIVRENNTVSQSCLCTYGNLHGAVSVRPAVSPAKRYLILLRKPLAPCGPGFVCVARQRNLRHALSQPLGTQGPVHTVFNISHRITLNY